MKYFETGGINVPVLGFGTWKLEGQTCTDAVKLALDIGYRHIDTAQIYMNEAEVGRALATHGTPRADIFLTTKIWRENVSADKMAASFEESLQKLQTDYVDMLLLHWPVSDVPLKEQLDALTAIKKSGKARMIGVSNYTTALMHESRNVCGAPISNNQVEYHPFINQQAVLDYVRASSMFLTAYSPLARGAVLEHPTLQAIGSKYGKTTGQVTLRWLIQQDNVVAIPKASSEKHIRANFDIFDFALTADDMNQINALARPDGRLINPEWAPAWDAPQPQTQAA